LFWFLVLVSFWSSWFLGATLLSAAPRTEPRTGNPKRKTYKLKPTIEAENPMSARNGDKSRHQINRKRGVHRRAKIRELVKSLKAQPAPGKTGK
jgi:hypothetical protein